MPALVILVLSSCAPNNAGKIRVDDPITVGPMGLQFRPSKSVGLNLALWDESGKWGETSEKNYPDGPELLAKSAYQEFNHKFIDLLYYPSDNSGFFVGIGGLYRQGHYTWNEHTSDPGIFAEVEYQEEAWGLGIPVGWTWIYSWGGTFQLNLGPYFYVQTKRKFVKGLDDGEVDVAERDATLKKIYSLHPLQGGKNYKVGAAVVGFSF